MTKERKSKYDRRRAAKPRGLNASPPESPESKPKRQGPPARYTLVARIPLEQRFAFTLDETLATGAFRSRNKLHIAIAAGELRTYMDGRRRMVSAEALREFIRNRERRAVEGGA